MSLPGGEPGVEFVVTIRNYERALRVVEKISDASYYRGMFRDVISDTLSKSRDFAAEVTHRQTGNLAASHMWEYNSHEMRGRLYINPRIVYVKGGALRWPRVYAAYEEGRGGDHAFYERTFAFMNASIPSNAFNMMIRSLDNAGR